MDKYDILVIGAGHFSKGFCYHLASICKESLRVKVLSRDKKRAEEIETISNGSASFLGSNIKFSSGIIDWSSNQTLQHSLEKNPSKVIFNTASLQSPWEFYNSSSEWTLLLKKVGFGITLPFQALLISRVARIIKAMGAETQIINACYPDVVNPFLKACGLEILCGVGNIAFLIPGVLADKSFDSNTKVQMIAHHYHTSTGSYGPIEIGEASSPKIWANERELENPSVYLQKIINISPIEQDHLAYLTTAVLFTYFFSGQEHFTHVVSPKGLPGGYPVRVKNFNIQIELPNSISLEEAIDWNQKASLLDGVIIDDTNNKVHFSKKTSSYLKQNDLSDCISFSCEELTEVYERFAKFKTHLGSAKKSSN